MSGFEDEVLMYYGSLTYEEQRRLLVAMTDFNKQPPYFILFKLDTTGLTRLAKVTAYCKKHKIEFKAEKAGKVKIRYRFNGMSERNAVLIGQLTL